ncbi:MAG: hypothetical protein KDI51_13945 [Xanthomonadales bacterium]|nr:hypothetical protein [Xanthomonadales bacterium]
MKVFLILLAQYNGKNNGVLALPRSEHPMYGLGANGRIVKNAIEELEDAGFIVTTRPGGCVPGAALYAITTEAIDASPRHDWPEEHKASHRWRNSDRTTVVQRPEPKQFKDARLNGDPCTKMVPIRRKTAD